MFVNHRCAISIYKEATQVPHNNKAYNSSLEVITIRVCSISDGKYMFKDTYIILPKATANNIPMTNATITPTTIPIMAAKGNPFITEPSYSN